MRILFFDPVNSDNHHAAFNSTVVSAAARLMKVDSIHLLVETNQLASCHFVDVLNHLKVHIYPLSRWNDIAEQRHRFHMLRRYQDVYRCFLKAVDSVKPDAVVFLAADNTVTPLVLVGIAARWRKLGLSTFVFCHNNLENLTNARLKRMLWTWGLRSTNAKTIVLVPYLAPLGRRMIPGASFRVLPNPTYAHLHDRWHEQNTQFREGVDFLFLGRHAREALHSGFLEGFLQHCTDFLHRTSERCVTLALPSDLEVNSPDRVILRSYHPYPSTPDYLSLIGSARFVVIPSCSGSRLTASGVLGDLLTLGTPALAPNEGTWQWQVSPKNRAFLFNNDYDLRSSILRALTLSEEEYQALVSDILNHSTLFDLDATSKQLGQILDNSLERPLPRATSVRNNN